MKQTTILIKNTTMTAMKLLMMRKKFMIAVPHFRLIAQLYRENPHAHINKVTIESIVCLRRLFWKLTATVLDHYSNRDNSLRVDFD